MISIEFRALERQRVFNAIPCVHISLVAQMVKNPTAMRVTWVQSLGWEDPLDKGMAAHVFLYGESHGQRSLVGYSP